MGEQGLEVNDRLSRVRFRAFVWRPWAMDPSSSADLRRRPIVMGRLYVRRATSKQGRRSPLLVMKWRRSVEPGKAGHLGIRINEEHTILTVADGEGRRVGGAARLPYPARLSRIFRDLTSDTPSSKVLSIHKGGFATNIAGDSARAGGIHVALLYA